MIGGLVLAIMLAAAPADQHRSPSILTGDTARPIGPTNWINVAEDYPAAAIRGRMDGAVAVRLFVNAQGRVTGCLVLEHADSLALELATCRILRSRAGFAPFAGGGLARFDYRIVWDLAQATPIPTCCWPPETPPVPAAPSGH